MTINWSKYRLGELALFDKGRVVPCQPTQCDSSLPYIGAENFSGVFNQYTTDPNALVCEPNDVLILWDGERSGLCASGLRGAIGSTVVRLRPKNRINGRFLYHQLNRYFPWIQARRTGTGVPHVPKDLSSILSLPTPDDVTEQLRIASVLDTVDATIARTEAVIAKLKQVRAGLLHDLLTSGLDGNGELRDPIAHPEQFRDTQLGRIPKGWDVLSLEQLLARVPNPIRSGPFGSALLKQELKPSGIPLLGIDNVHVEQFIDRYTRFVDEDKYQELQRYTVRPRDLMVTIMGTVGRCCVVPTSIGTALSSKHVWTVTLDSAQYSPDIACWQINYAPWILGQLRKDEQGGVMASIRSETLRSLLFPVPSPTELKIFEKILYAFSEAIHREIELRLKYESLKSGLMADLLTGKVRVPEGMDI